MIEAIGRVMGRWSTLAAVTVSSRGESAADDFADIVTQHLARNIKGCVSALAASGITTPADFPTALLGAPEEGVPQILTQLHLAMADLVGKPMAPSGAPASRESAADALIREINGTFDIKPTHGGYGNA